MLLVMCGRFTLCNPEVVEDVFELADVPDIKPRWNIAPTQNVAAVRVATGEMHRRCHLLRWGLVPQWAKDPGLGARLINARAETVSSKPAFRNAFRERRCLIVADGFYEWQKLGSRKQPHYVRLRDARPFAFAGLWERWNNTEADPIESCTIITTEPNELVAPLHDRMPVILQPENYDMWLDPDLAKVDALQPLLRPFPSEPMVAHAVSLRVNNPSNDSAECIEPVL